MKYLYWVGVALVIGVGVWLTTLVNPQPTTKNIVPFAQYETPEDLGKQIFTALQSEVKRAPIVLLGVTPNQVEDMEVWRGFMQANQEVGSKYEIIAVEPMLPYVELFESNLRFNIRDDMPRFVEGVKKAMQQGLRVAVLVPHIYSSQLIAGNPVDRLQKEFEIPILSLSIVKFPVTLQQAEIFEPACVLEEGKDPGHTGPLGCMIRKVAKKTYDKKFEDNKYSGLVEKLSANDYLILFNRNAGSK
ncbi:hypothetical protein AZI86_04640 [Bdellovibrio bacteriovorus]|uniref:Uncharacterized protein n=1 Tax=Bdellovibrio bacteriovorus TaxID=959 RepID=A0A150WPQ8_BDEBC|nr:hypothetical protein [Bdellovibrio bacteriovorus]KYG66346.1 hypothetical protein AZI86_04640 [Bdellovibrio bacteriovorus]